GEGAGSDLSRRDARQQEGVRVDGQALQGLVRAVPRERDRLVLQEDLLLEDADRRLRERQEGLHGLHEVAAGLDSAERLSGPATRARRRLGGALWPPNRLPRASTPPPPLPPLPPPHLPP